MSMAEIYNHLYVQDVMDLCAEYNEAAVIEDGKITRIIENEED